jgi:small conductance mechanosensitive channel
MPALSSVLQTKMERQMRKVLVLLLCWMMSGGILAQEQDVGTADKLNDQVTHIEERIEQIRGLSKHLDMVLESDREAILYRRDTQGFALMRDLDNLARAVSQLPEDSPQRQQMIRRLSGDFSGLVEAVFERSKDLSERIAHYTEQAKQESGAAKLVIEAYISNLKNLRIQSYETAADVIDGRSVLGLPVDGMRENLSQQLFLSAETLVGKLSFTGSAARAMNNRLKEDPENAELDTATRAMAVRHSQGRQRLESVSALLGRMGLDNVVYKTELLQQGQDFSIRDFEKDVFVRLLEKGWKNVKTAVTTQAPDFVFRAFTFLLIVMVFRALARLVRRLVIAACESSGADMSILLKDVLASVSGGSITLMGLLIALSQVGISVGPMLAGLGVAGFIVGFALQDTLGNFAAGGMILIYRPYDVDDFVEVVGASGLVKKMSLVSTTITTFDNQTLVVPNSKIWGDVIKNVTAQKLRRVDLEFGISYSDDVEHVERVLSDIVETHEMVLDKPAPLIKLHTLEDSSVNFIVRPWVKTEDYWSVYWDLTREVKLRFDREGISIPFPQSDVHVYRDNG